VLLYFLSYFKYFLSFYFSSFLVWFKYILGSWILNAKFLSSLFYGFIRVFINVRQQRMPLLVSYFIIMLLILVLFLKLILYLFIRLVCSIHVIIELLVTILWVIINPIILLIILLISWWVIMSRHSKLIIINNQLKLWNALYYKNTYLFDKTQIRLS
jgi:hypothetical protein